MNEEFEFETFEEQPSLLETEEAEFRMSTPIVRDHRSVFRPGTGVRWKPSVTTTRRWPLIQTARPVIRPGYPAWSAVRPGYTAWRPVNAGYVRPGYPAWPWRPGYTARRPPYYWRQPLQWQPGYRNAPGYWLRWSENPFAPGGGTRDDQIRWIQHFLNRILNQNLPVDGVMSPATRTAVRNFQQRYGLPATGYVGPDTQQALVATTSSDGGMQIDPNAANQGVDAADAPGGTVVGATQQNPPGADADARELLEEYGLPAGEFGFESESENWESELALGYSSFLGLGQNEFEEQTLENAFDLETDSTGPNMTGRAGFGNAPQSFALRVRIIGYASPRWRGAKNAAEADRLNFDLSSKRAQAVQDVVERELRAKLGDGIKIDYAVSQMEPRNPQGIEIGSHGAGSSDALTAAHGDRSDNSEQARRVEVMIEKITTTYTTGGVSFPPQRVPGKTDSWALGVTKVRMLAVGAAIGSIEIALRNRLTNKQVFATANLYGGGLGAGTANAGNSISKQIKNAVKNNLMQAVGDFIGRGEVFFTTESKMGFEDFDNEFIRIGKITASLGLKAVYAYAAFPFISHHPELLVFQKKVTIGLPDLEGWLASGKLHLRGPNPGNWSEYDRTGLVHSSYDKSWQETLVLTFKTGKWELVPTDKSRLTHFVDTWARRFI